VSYGGTYGPDPRNLTLADVRAEMQRFIQSQSITGSWVPKSIPFSTMDTPLVEHYPSNPQDRDEINLYDPTGPSVTRWVWIKAKNQWVQIPSAGPAVSATGQAGAVGWSAGTIPTGTLAADGSSVLRASYPDLFTAIGVTWGAADGTHFNVPLLVDKFVVGAGNLYALAATGGTAASNMPAHTHTGPSHTHSISSDGDHSHTVYLSSVGGATSGYSRVGDGTNVEIAGITGTNGAHTHSGATGSAGTGATGSAGSGGASDNLPPYVALNPYIWT
jgi:microcystin-dependent protein